MVKTPYYLIDEVKLSQNLKKIQRLRDLSGVKSVLALKCFSTWSVFDLMSKYMDGTTSSSVYEARLGYEKFGKETHAYCVAYSDDDIEEIQKYADKIIFNSISQLKRYSSKITCSNIGLRINPGISYSSFDLADPARKHSRLGVVSKSDIMSVLNDINGIMMHFNCENDNFVDLNNMLNYVKCNYSDVLKNIDWLSLGGGIFFTKENYPLEELGRTLQKFSDEFDLQIYIEPGEASITNSAELVTTVLDIVHNEIDIAIVDASIEAHTLDLLTYNLSAKINLTCGNNTYMIAGRSCLAGDVFGTYTIDKRLKVGDEVRILDAAGYTMVKKNWFNGLQMPSIVIKRLNGSIDMIRKFDYFDFMNNLS